MSLLSLLAGAFGGNSDPSAPTAPVLNADGQASTDVSPIDVVATRKPAPVASPPPPPPPPAAPAPPMNYDNTADIAAVHKALDAEPAPEGGSTNPGLYGLLPKSLQHGTLRNVLGSLGDAFLVQSGNKAVYGPHMQAQAEGNAMAGYGNNPQAAIERLNALGTPNAPELAEKYEQNYQTAQNRKTQLEYTQAYRDQLNQSKSNETARKYMPVIGGLISQAKDSASYARAFQAADSIYSKIGTSALEQGLPSPTEWQPGMTDGWGMTANNEQVTGDKAQERNVQVRGQNMNLQGREYQADSSSSASRYRTDNPNPTQGSIVDGLMQRDPSTWSPQETAYFNHATQSGRRSKPNYAPVPSSGNPTRSGGVGVQPNGQPNLPKDPQGNYYVNPNTPLTEAQAMALPKGHSIHFRGLDNKWHVRP